MPWEPALGTYCLHRGVMRLQPCQAACMGACADGDGLQDQPWMAACLNLLHVQWRWLGVSALAKRHRLEVDLYESCPLASTGRHALLCGV